MLSSSGYKVILDACVLLPPNLCDLLLRCAEDPALYSPKWTRDILAETKRNQVLVNRLSPERAASWEQALLTSFPDSLVTHHEKFIGECTNNEKDRHVLAAAIRANCDIVTANLKDFKEEHLSRWGIAAIHPADFLSTMLSYKPAIMVAKVDDMVSAKRRNIEGFSREDLLLRLTRSVPVFAADLAEELRIDLRALKAERDQA